MYKINGNPENFADLQVFHKLAKQFIPYAQKKMGFDRPVGINLISDPENAKNPLGKTAHYDPNKLEVTVFIDKRHVKDILRSMSHELVHHTQNCRGDLENRPTGPGYAQEDAHMRDMEREAYERGQLVLRDFEDNLKKKENQKMSRIDEVSDEVKARTAPRDKANKADFLPKDVRDEINAKQKKVQTESDSDDPVDKAKATVADVRKLVNKAKNKSAARQAVKDMFGAGGEKILKDLLKDETVDEAHCPSGKRDGDVEEGKKKSKKCPVCKKVKCEGSCNEGQINEENEDDSSPATTTPNIDHSPGEKPPSEKKAKPPADQQKPKDRGVTMENWTRKNKNELLFERLVKKWAK